MKRAAGRIIQSWIYYTSKTIKLVRFSAGGQLDDLDFGFNEDMEDLDIRGRHYDGGIWTTTAFNGAL